MNKLRVQSDYADRWVHASFKYETGNLARNLLWHGFSGYNQVCRVHWEDEKMKWVNSLVFTMVVLFPSIAIAENCQMEAIKSLMQELDKAKVESVLKLSNEIKAYSEGKEFACVEPLIVDFISFYQQSIEKFSEANGIWDLPNPMPVEKKDELDSKIQKVGWELMESEGAYLITDQAGWMLNEFGGILNQSWKDYFALVDVELNEEFVPGDGRVVVASWKSICDRIIRWDEFMAQYPGFPLIGTIRYDHSLDVEAFLIGTEDKSVFNQDEDQLLPEVKKEYERFIKVNSKSKYHPMIKDYYELLSKKNFNVDEQTIGFLTQESVRRLFEEVKPHIR